jgi:hypothetical protein
MYSLHLRSGFVAVITFVLCLAACGPVKFTTDDSSSDGEQTNIDPNPTDPTDPTTPTTPTYRNIDNTSTVQGKATLVDIVLIVDDSNSMLEDNRRLAQRLSTFTTNLKNSQLDWQMCVTTTRALPVSGSTDRAWGASIYWQTNAASPTSALGFILKNSSSTDLSTVFAQTIEYIGANRPNSQDERGIKAAYHHAKNGNYNASGSSGCYRDGAATAYILISDEDERSVGGELAMEQYAGQEYYALENEDKPQYFVDMTKSVFGADKRMTFNSIIVKPSDTACKASQDAAGFYSHYGKRYYELSGLTGGGVGSICDTDFYSNLTNIFNRITQSLSSLPLECAPVGNVAVTITPAMSGVTTSVSGQTLNFSTAIPEGRSINVKYKCLDTRSPSSVGAATPTAELGFFAKIANFFKNLF